MAGSSRRPTRQQQAAARRRAEQTRLRWEERERKRVAREFAEQEKLLERQRREADHARQISLAAERTTSVEQRFTELTSILGTALQRTIRPLDFEQLKSRPVVVPLDLGADAQALAPPRWEDFAPAPPGSIGRAFGGQARYESRMNEAKQEFGQATEAHRVEETARRRRVTVARSRHAETSAQAERQASAQHAEVMKFKKNVLDGERHAVSEYYQRILDDVPVPSGFPRGRRAAYVPESTLLAVEWELPGPGVLPTDKEFGFVKTRNAVEVRKSYSVAERRSAYQEIVSQLALQTLHTVFESDLGDLVETIVFNGLVDDIDDATGQPVRPCLITLRATREHFAKVNMHQAKPVACVRKHFAAEVSDHPEALAAVEPILAFDMADPRIVDAPDIISELDRRPNLMDLTPKQFEEFVTNLFDRLGFDTKLFRASGDGGIDCIAYDPAPIRGGKYVIQVKQYSRTVPPSAVRDLFGTMHDQGATKGILITTSGFGPSSHEFANNKPLQLYDGTQFLWLCQQQGIDARIVLPPKTRAKQR
jgi:restriction system protein